MTDSTENKSALVRFGDRHSKPLTVLGFLMVVLGLVFAFGRVYKDYSTPLAKKFDWGARGLSDLHNCHTYAKTFRLGLSPYEFQDREDLQVSRPSAAFSPSIFYLLWPLTYLSVANVDVIFSLINVGMLGLLGWMVFRFSGSSFSLHWWLAVFGFIIFSRSGHITLFTGYFTAVVVIGTLLSFQFADSKPWLAGIGVLLASAKPTFIIPLLFLLVYRRNYRAAIWGALLSGAVAFAGITWMASNSSFSEVINSVMVGQEAFAADPTEFPINTWTRIDLIGMFAKMMNSIPGNKTYLFAMLILMVPPGLTIRRAVLHEQYRGAMGLSAVIASLALLVTLYHHSYDCMLIIPAGLALLLFGHRTMPEVPRVARLIVAGLLTVPAVNYFSTLSVRDKLGMEQYSFAWQSITMINGFCLTISMLILMYYAWTRCVPEPLVLVRDSDNRATSL